MIVFLIGALTLACVSMSIYLIIDSDAYYKPGKIVAKNTESYAVTDRSNRPSVFYKYYFHVILTYEYGESKTRKIRVEKSVYEAYKEGEIFPIRTN